MIKTLKVEDFATLFGTTIDDFDTQTMELINTSDFRYKELDKEKRDSTILEILKYIDSDKKKIGDKDRWEKGWSENLNSFIENRYDLSKLVPLYVKSNQILRLYQDYVIPCDAYTEINFFTVMRHWMLKRYLKDLDVVYEFGCGPGYNLTLIHELFPDKKLYGLDWSTSSINILNILKYKLGMNINGILFDMFDPDYGINLEQNSLVLTIGSMEQIGGNHQKFTDFLIDKNPELCVHIEPLYELYDENNLVDNIAMRFHKNRNYLNNFLPTLLNLEKENKINILKINRMKFGSIFHDGWSMIVWSPRND